MTEKNNSMTGLTVPEIMALLHRDLTKALDGTFRTGVSVEEATEMVMVSCLEILSGCSAQER